jgi:hypothetical protein
MMTEAQKRWIDNASYDQLLNKWRFAPVGDPMFQGETGEYYADRMSKLRKLDPDAHVRASKTIGWK